jgi:hypothetical protein
MPATQYLRYHGRREARHALIAELVVELKKLEQGGVAVVVSDDHSIRVTRRGDRFHLRGDSGAELGWAQVGDVAAAVFPS